MNFARPWSLCGSLGLNAHYSCYLNILFMLILISFCILEDISFMAKNEYVIPFIKLTKFHMVKRWGDTWLFAH
jgi:hypothetical protein